MTTADRKIHVELVFVGSKDCGLVKMYEMRFVDSDGKRGTVLEVSPDREISISEDDTP